MDDAKDVFIRWGHLSGSASLEVVGRTGSKMIPFCSRRHVTVTSHVTASKLCAKSRKGSLLPDHGRCPRHDAQARTTVKKDVYAE